MQHHYIITFDSTHDALFAERQLKEQGFQARIVPLPAVLAAGCGFSVQIPEEVLPEVKTHMVAVGMSFHAFYAVEKVGMKRNYVPCSDGF